MSVSCVTVFRALQTPATALLERVALGEAQSARRHGCYWLVAHAHARDLRSRG